MFSGLESDVIEGHQFLGSEKTRHFSESKIS